MKKAALIILPAIALAMTIAMPAPAQAQQGPRIAVINSAQAFQDSVAGKKVIAQLQERDTKLRGEMKKMDDAILALQSRLTTGQMTMTQEAVNGLQADLNKKTTERKRYEEDATREFQQFRDGLIQPIQKEMIELTKVLRKEKGLDIVLDLTVSGAVDFDPAIDLTAELIRRYDAMKAPAPAAPVKK